MRDKDQKMRFNNAELSLLKSVFADNEELLFIVRKVLLQGELSEHEEVTLRKTLNSEVLRLLRKFFLPEVDVESPLFQMTDLVLGLGADIRDKHVDEAGPYIRAKELEINYLNQQLAVLENLHRGAIVDTEKIDLAKLARLKLTKTNKEDVWVNVMARNFILSFIDTHIQQMKFLAGLKTETVEETIARLQKDSNK